MFLPSGWLIAVLPPTDRIHLGQQRGGHLDEGHAALVAGRGKADHVADHPSAEGDEVVLRSPTVAEQAVEDEVEVGQSLCASPSGSTISVTRMAPARAAGDERAPDTAADHGVGDHGDRLLLVGQDGPVGQQPGADGWGSCAHPARRSVFA